MAGRAMNLVTRFVSLAASLVLAACSPSTPAREAPPLAGARIGGPFTLTDQGGHTFTDRSFAGKYRIVYFGYTYCPDVCPRDAQNIGAGLRLVERADPALGARIVPLFITVDPARDTPAVLEQFVRAFHPRMVGLTGSQAAIDAVAKEYGIYHHKGETTSGGGYMMDHTEATYLMSPDDKPLALLPSDKSPQAVADEIRRWAT